MPAPATAGPGADREQRPVLGDALDGWTAGTRGGREKGGFAETVAAETGAEVERLIGAGPAHGIDFEAVETAARRLALEVVGKALGLDGTGVPVRKAETQGRRGKQSDGSAKTREAKIVAVWSAETRDRDGHPARDPDSTSCSAAIETVAGRDTDALPAPFAARALREARRRCFQDAPRRVVLGDGAPWIWNWADEHAPGAIQIVDVRHAKEHLCAVAKAIFGAGTDLADQWGRQRRDELDQGRIDDILDALRRHADTHDDARKCIACIDTNRHRMRYPKFRAMGPCVATGVVEGACKNVVGARLERGGMHWTVDGANAILALRCAILGNRFDDFWERRASTA